jgi:hypothetical protein
MTTETTLTKYLVSNLDRFYMNPSSMMQVATNGLALALKGVDIVDPSNPFVYLLETAMCASAVSIAKSEALSRKQYPYLAQSMDDLYHHMSDTDYIGIFATGGKSTLNWMIPFYQLLNDAIPLVAGSAVKTVIIPRDTKIFVNDLTMQIGYAVIINILPGELIQVYYDTSVPNPLVPYLANVIAYNYLTYEGTKYLQFELPVIQVSSFSKKFTLGQTASFYQSISFINHFCYARVFMSNGTSSWVELLTTFSDKVYDVEKPTMLLSLTDNTLSVTLPDIYQTLNTVDTSIRVDIYTTLGDISTDLSQVTYNNFSATFDNYDTLNNANINAVAALNKINDIVIQGTGSVTGGINPLTFDEVSQRVIYRINSKKAPIRPTDITAELSTRGYSTEVLLNNVSSRMYLASKNLPANTVAGFSASPLATNNVVKVTISNYTLNDTSGEVIVHSSGRTSILPGALFSISNGDASLLTPTEINEINSLSGKQLCDKLNSGIYMYTPFTYILDYSDRVFVGRAYYLDDPKVTGRNLLLQNTQRVYNIATMSSSVTLSGNTYKLMLTAAIPSNLQTVLCQISYFDVGSGTTVYLDSLAAVYSNQATFEFDILTNFDINTANQLKFLNFKNASGSNEPLFFDMTTTFNVFYLVPGDNSNLHTAFDTMFTTPRLNRSTGVIGATYETISVYFGKHLPNLYCPVYENLTAGEYLTYPDDVPAVYEDIVYVSGPDGPSFTIDASGNVDLQILHHVGDPILDDLGNVVYLHRSGDYILSNGLVIPTSNYTNGVSYNIGVTMIDAKCKYASSITTTMYAKTLPSMFLSYLDNDIQPLTKLLNEQTKLWYKPSGESFSVNVNLGNGIITNVVGLLDVQITIYMNRDGLENTSLQTQTTNLCRQVISAELQKSVLSVSQLMELVKTVLPSQAISYSIDKYLPNGATMITILDKTQTFSIGSKILVQSDNTLDVVDSISILYDSDE